MTKQFPKLLSIALIISLFISSIGLTSAQEPDPAAGDNNSSEENEKNTSYRVVLPLVGSYSPKNLTNNTIEDESYPIIEEFDSDTGFTSTNPGRVYIADGKVHWNISRRGGPQFVYRDIPAFSGDVKLTVQGQVNSWNNNCIVRAGIGDGFDARSDQTGISINYGFVGGGCGSQRPTTPPGAIVMGTGAQFDYYESPACNYHGNWLRINPSTPYTAEFTISDGLASLSVPDVGTATGTPFYDGQYDTLYVGLNGTGDWPSCSGTIDSIKVEQLEPTTEYDCNGTNLSYIGEAVSKVVGEQNYCKNSFEGLIKLPELNENGKLSGRHAFEKFANLAENAKYEVDFVSMDWDEENEEAQWDDYFTTLEKYDDSPMMIFLRGIQKLYLKVKKSPGEYPGGVKVRILVGKKGNNPTGYYGKDHRKLIYEALVDRLGVELIDTNWQIEIGVYRNETIPNHSHVKMMIVDGKTAIVAGYNMQYFYLNESDSPEGGNPYPTVDAGVKVSGPIVQNILSEFDYLWLFANLCSKLDKNDDCDGDDVQFPIDHDPLVNTIQDINTSSPTVVFSLFRDHLGGNNESDKAIEAALKAAETQINIIQNRYFDLSPLNSDEWPYEAGIMEALNRVDFVRIILPLYSSSVVSSIADIKINKEGFENLIAQATFYGNIEKLKIGFLPRPIHGKAFSIDGKFVVVGSQNWDFSAFTGKPGALDHPIDFPLNKLINLAEYNLGIDDENAASKFDEWYDMELWEDTWPYTTPSIWDQVVDGVETATEGIVVSLEEGVYFVKDGAEIIVDKGATLIGEGPGKTIIECASPNITPFTFTKSLSLIANITFRNCDYAAILKDVSSSSLEDMTISNVVFQNNQSGGILVEGLVPGSPVNFTIENNTFIGGKAGIVINLTESQSQPSRISNNIFSGQSVAPIHIVSADDGNNVEYSYNLFHNCGTDNNCITGWKAGPIGPQSSVQNNIYDLDPEFVDPDVGNYELLPTSPAIDAGDPDIDHAFVLDGDFDGFPRIDIGAYETLVLNAYPKVDAGSDQIVNEGDTVSLPPATFNDPDGDEHHVSTIDWGDGTVEPGSIDESGGLGIVAGSYIFGDNGTYTIKVIVCDDEEACGEDSFKVSVRNVAPIADAGSDETIFRNETITVSGSWTDPAEDLDSPYSWKWDLDGDGLSDKTGSANYGEMISETTSFPTEGKYTLTFEVTDKDGGTGSDNLEITVLNRPPVCSEAKPSIDNLWSPNHKFVSVDVLGLADPDGDTLSVNIDSIFQDEPVDSYGDGSFTPDGRGVGTSTAELRVERAGGGNGRVYHVSFTADDGHGGTCSGKVLVGVPKSSSPYKAPVDEGPLYDSTKVGQ